MQSQENISSVFFRNRETYLQPESNFYHCPLYVISTRLQDIHLLFIKLICFVSKSQTESMYKPKSSKMFDLFENTEIVQQRKIQAINPIALVMIRISNGREKRNLHFLYQLLCTRYTVHGTQYTGTSSAYLSRINEMSCYLQSSYCENVCIVFV